ncbi:MAG: protein kinase [Anaerolineaceae bacterium]
MSELTPGYVLNNRYRIISLLGKGGMGEVYQAEDQNLANLVAVKVNHNLDPHASAQFIREARLLASLKHPNLPRVIDYFTGDGSEYLVMDFIPGENLKTLVERKTQLSNSMNLHWAEQLGSALTYLHTQNPPVYHRDVKPANIKLTPAGEVILVDFGIAKTGDVSQETQTGAWAYSPGYAPPEQVSGLRTGPYSDQFSLAATLYFLFTGVPPVDSAQRMIGEQELLPVQSFNPSIPPHTAKAIHKAMEIKPDERFSTINDFIAAICNTSPIPDPSSLQHTVVSTSRAEPPKPPALPGSLPPASPQVPLPPVEGKKRSFPIGWIIGFIAVAIIVVGGVSFLSRRNNTPPATPVSQPSPTTSVEILVVSATPESEPTSTPQPTAEPTVTQSPTETPAPVYSPVGRGGKIAFVSNRQADGYDQIWLMEVVQDETGSLLGINPVQLTFNEGNKSKPAWSPDGTKLLYSGWSTGITANGNPMADDIWILDLANPGSEPVNLTQRQRDDRYAAWSPLGDQIVFTSYYRDDGIPQLFLMNPDGSGQTRLSERFAESYATWTPNAEFILFVQSTGNLNVVYMRDKYSQYLDGEHKFDRSTDEGRLGFVSEPNLSLDGAMLAYTRTVNNGKTNIYIAPFVDRGKTVVALSDSGMDNAPFWSPDGNWLVFTSIRDGNAEIYIIDRDGNHLTNLTDLASQDKDPAWQPVSFPMP